MEKVEINQNKSEIPEEILYGIVDHYTRAYQSDKTIIAVDLEENSDEETFDIIAENLLTFFSKYFYEAYVDVSNRDLVDLLSQYPDRRVFVLTTTEHLKKHDILELEHILYNERNKIKRYESAFKYYINERFVGVNTSSPQAVGVEFHTHTITEDDALREIAKIITEPLILDLDKIESANGVYPYAEFKKYWVIYENQPKLKYKYVGLTNQKEETRDKITVEVKWLLFAEMSTTFLSDLFYL